MTRRGRERKFMTLGVNLRSHPVFAVGVYVLTVVERTNEEADRAERQFVLLVILILLRKDNASLNYEWQRQKSLNHHAVGHRKKLQGKKEKCYLLCCPAEKQERK